MTAAKFGIGVAQFDEFKLITQNIYAEWCKFIMFMAEKCLDSSNLHAEHKLRRRKSTSFQNNDMRLSVSFRNAFGSSRCYIFIGMQPKYSIHKG